jgi:hypothetical protein
MRAGNGVLAYPKKAVNIIQADRESKKTTLPDPVG